MAIATAHTLNAWASADAEPIRPIDLMPWLEKEEPTAAEVDAKVEHVMAGKRRKT